MYRNKSIENVITIDLHGQHVRQALRLLKVHLLFGAYVRCKNLVHSSSELFISECTFFVLAPSKLSNFGLKFVTYCCLFLSILFYHSCPVFQGYHGMWESRSGEVKAEAVGMGSNHSASFNVALYLTTVVIDRFLIYFLFSLLPLPVVAVNLFSPVVI